jgi:hypothetical protein
VFDNSGWGIKEKSTQNTDQTTLPVVNDTTLDEFVKQWSDNALGFMSMYCKFIDSTIEQWFFTINITYNE